MNNEGKAKRHNGPKNPYAAQKHADWEMNKDNFIKGGLHKSSKKDMNDKKPKRVDLDRLSDDELDEAANAYGRQDAAIQRGKELGWYKNPYEGMTWDEYVAAKAKEREEEAMPFKPLKEAKVLQLTESDIRSMVQESVKKILNDTNKKK